MIDQNVLLDTAAAHRADSRSATAWGWRRSGVSRSGAVCKATVAQAVVGIQVFVALAQGEDALTQHILGAMTRQGRNARIRQHLRRDCFEEAESPLDFAQQQ